MGVLPYHPYRKQMLIMAGSSWLVLLFMFVFVKPSFIQHVGLNNSYIPLYVILFPCFFWLTWGMSGRWKRSLTWSGAGTVFVWLRVNQLDSWVNVLLLFGLCVVWGYYWHLTKPEHRLIK